MVAFYRTTVARAIAIAQYFDRSELLEVWLIKTSDPESFENFRDGLSEVKIKDDGDLITFQFPNRTVRSIRPKQKRPIKSDLRGVVARTVFETRLTMQLILRHLQYFDIERLRKVNRGIRECVDLIKPNPHIERLSIRFYQRDHNVTLRTYTELGNGGSKDVEYFMVGNKVRVYGGNFFPGTDFKSMCLNDIERTLDYQIECMKELIILYECTIAYAKIFENRLGLLSTVALSRGIGDLLKGREKKLKTTLKTNKFSMGSNSQMEVMEILAAIDSQSLKIIEFLYPSDQAYLRYANVIELSFEVDQISQTDQWNNAEQMISKYLTITTPIQKMNITHFVNLEILVKTLTSGDVAYLKTKLLKSSKFQKFKILFLKSVISESLHILLGEPYRIFSDVKKIWYFRMMNTDYYMHIALDTRVVKYRNGCLNPKSVTFTRVAEEDTPFFDIAMNQLVIN